MNVDPLWGVGSRAAGIAGTVTTVELQATNTGLAATVPPGNVASIAIPANVRVFAISAFINPTSSGSSIDSAQFTINVDGKAIAKWQLPNNDTWLNNIQEIIPVDITSTANSILEVNFGPFATDLTGYNIGYRIVAYLVSI